MGLELSGSQSFALTFAKAKFFRNGFLSAGDSFDSKKYAGGRFVVQGGNAQACYERDKYAGITVSTSPFFLCENENVCMTCCKTDKNGHAIVRLVNLSSRPVSANIEFSGIAEKIDLSEENSEYLGKDNAVLTFAPKQIITLKIKNLL